MTDERLIKANRLRAEIDALNEKIEEIGAIIRGTKYTTDIPLDKWVVEIAPNNSWSSIKIDHRGMLKTFLEWILDDMTRERNRLREEYDKL